MTTDSSLRRRLTALARSLLGNRWEAEELVHDCFVRVHESPPRQLRSEEAWLVTLVRHLAIDRLRRRRVEQQHLSELAAGAHTHAEAPLSAERAADLSRTAEQALRWLARSSTPAEAAVVLLHEVFEMEYAEIALRCGKRADALRQMAHRSLQALASRSPALLYTLLAPAITTAEALLPMRGPVPEASRSHCTLAQIDGRFAMLVMFEGRVLCSLPLGVIGGPACDPAADAWVDSFSQATGR